MVAFARALGAAVWGVEARLVDVQVFVPGVGETGTFRIVGLGDGAVREGRERIRGAVLHAGYPWPEGAVTVNLAPASARKEGPALDLPIALALLEASGSLGAGRALGRTMCLGELTLDGRLRSVRGALAATEAGRAQGYVDVLVPVDDAVEAAAVEGVRVRAVATLGAAVAHLRGAVTAPLVAPTAWTPAPADGGPLRAVRGQAEAVRAAVLAAAGGHNLLLIGAPGAGKTLVARALGALLPALTRAEALEVARIHGASGLLEGALPTRRPFRAPHHTTSTAGLLGGGALPRPGEVSLAHRGVLFLDELAEFPRPTLEALRQPIEDGEILIGRAAGRARFPCEAVLVAAMNPCPCGWHGSKVKPCRCPASLSARYRARVSGPLLDRFDLRVFVSPVTPEALLADDVPRDDVPRDDVDVECVGRARRRQVERARALGLVQPWNARIPAAALRAAVRARPDAEALLRTTARRVGLSARGMHRALRVARTAADLADEEDVHAIHVGEATRLRGEEATSTDGVTPDDRRGSSPGTSPSGPSPPGAAPTATAAGP